MDIYKDYTDKKVEGYCTYKSEDTFKNKVRDKVDSIVKERFNVDFEKKVVWLSNKEAKSVLTKNEYEIYTTSIYYNNGYYSMDEEFRLVMSYNIEDGELSEFPEKELEDAIDSLGLYTSLNKKIMKDYKSVYNKLSKSFDSVIDEVALLVKEYHEGTEPDIPEFGSSEYLDVLYTAFNVSKEGIKEKNNFRKMLRDELFRHSLNESKDIIKDSKYFLKYEQMFNKNEDEWLYGVHDWDCTFILIVNYKEKYIKTRYIDGDGIRTEEEELSYEDIENVDKFERINKMGVGRVIKNALNNINYYDDFLKELGYN